MSHSHLPPRPEFDNPTSSRYPPDSRYNRSMAPPPDRYRDPRDPYPPRSPPRDRDVYIPRSPPPRSVSRSSVPYSRDPPRDPYPPRDLHPPPRDIHPSPRDAYPPPRDPPPRDLPPRDLPPRDPYYDRRESDRYYRDWERRDPPEYRSRPPPPRDYGREPADWRDRDVDRGRRWEEERRRAYDWDRRERSPIRDRGYARPRDDDRPIPRERPREFEPERRWVPRASKSPPRRIASGSVSRGRSPTPPRFRESPTRPGYAPPRSPPPRASPRASPRYPSPGVLKLGNHSIEVTSRYAPSRRDRGYPRSRSRSPNRFFSRSRSRSPLKRSTPGTQSTTDRSRPDEPKREEKLHRLPVPTIDRVLNNSQFIEPTGGEKLQKPPLPDLGDLRDRDSHPSATVDAASMKTPIQSESGQSPDAKPVPVISYPPRSPTSSQSQKSPTSSSHPRRRSRSPPTQPRHYVKTPTTPSTPQLSSPGQNLPVKPEWSRKASPLSTSTPIAEAAPTLSGRAIALPPYHSPRSVSHDVEAEISRMEGHRGRLTTEYAAISNGKQRALHELDLASRDLKLAEQRRAVADSQLEKARAGALGIDYSAESNNT